MFKNELIEKFERDPYAPSISELEATSRITYLKKVYAWTLGGLAVTGVSGTAATFFLAQNPGLLRGFVPLVVMLGCMFFAQWFCAGLVQKASSAVLGFVMACAAMGVALGFPLLAAVVISKATSGDPFLIVAQALGLTFLTTASVSAYVWTNPSEFRWANAILSALFIPMLVLMAITWFFPVGGPIGLAISAVFIFVSVIGLLLGTRDVMHKLSEDQVMPGAYIIAMGIIVLFWNILVLLIKLQGRNR